MTSDNEIMKGKHVLITGATAGIGRAAAADLARKGARVLGISRNPDKCLRIADEIRSETGNPEVHYFCADLSSLAHVRQVAADALVHLPKIDILINKTDCLSSDKVRHVHTTLLDFRAILEQVMVVGFAGVVPMRIRIDTTGMVTEEKIKTTGIGLRCMRRTEVPLSNNRCSVTSLPRQIGNCFLGG